jgi:hypothetical protein
VQNCEAEVSHTKLWAQSGFGAVCGNLGTINAQRASIYRYTPPPPRSLHSFLAYLWGGGANRNGWTFVQLFKPSYFVDTACLAGTFYYVRVR